MANPTPAGVTATRRLADTLLDSVMNTSLDAYVAERRGRGMSWRLISRDLLDDIKVDVTERTLTSWYPELRDTAEKAS